MTISSTTVKNSYSGNGTLNTFNYTFKIFADADIQVIIRDASATETVKTLTTHYTVTGAGNANGGTIVFTAGNIPTATETVVLRRALPQTQSIDYIANDSFPAESHEEGLDRSMMAIQQLQEEVDRSIKLSRTNTMNTTEFAIGSSDRAGKIFGFDSNGELVVSQELGTFKGNWSASTTYAARDIVKDTSTNNIFLANTGHTSSGSQPLTTNTDSAKWDLLVDAESATASALAAGVSATAASTSETNAATSASTATTKASEASTSASNASTSETNAATSATNSANSATASASSASAAAATFDLFDDAYLGAKATNPTLDNDGDALQDGALYFDTTNDVMKVYDLGTTTWYQLTPTVSNQTNINAVNANSANINAVAANENNINNVNSNSANINTTAGISSDVTSVASNSAAIVAVNNNETNINAVNANSANINLVASNNTNVTNVGTNIASITTAATNLADINAFANIYLGPSASAPTLDPDGSALDVGDLYFDTVSQTMKVYSSSGWIPAGSSVNGTSSRFTYTVSSSTTTITGADDNTNTLAYDAGFVDVYLNGVKMVNGTDVTVTSGTSIVFSSAIGTVGTDVVDIIAFGTFQLSNFSINDANDVSTGGISDGQVLVYNSSASAFQPGNASSAEVYGFSKNASGQLIITTTNGGADNISASDYAAFDDVLFSASGFTFSINNDGNLVATI
ncbi:putative tail fiber [Pelagibacter phage HTVC024P]|nr:putative tail fiber [Pelagibacter phage HTVC024P]